MLTYQTLPEEIKNAYQRNITTSVVFVSKKGLRPMAYRRNLNAYVHSFAVKTAAQANIAANNNLITVYDTNLFIKNKRELGDDAKAASGSYRRIVLDTVVAFMVGGQVFDMRAENNIRERFGDEAYMGLTKNMVKQMKDDVINTDDNLEEIDNANIVNEIKILQKKLNLLVEIIHKKRIL